MYVLPTSFRPVFVPRQLSNMSFVGRKPSAWWQIAIAHPCLTGGSFAPPWQWCLAWLLGCPWASLAYRTWWTNPGSPVPPGSRTPPASQTWSCSGSTHLPVQLLGSNPPPPQLWKSSAGCKACVASWSFICLSAPDRVQIQPIPNRGDCCLVIVLVVICSSTPFFRQKLMKLTRYHSACLWLAGICSGDPR